MKKVNLSRLESLEGEPISAAYALAKELKFKVAVMSKLPFTELFYKVLFVRLSEDDTIEKVWCNENHIEIDK